MIFSLCEDFAELVREMPAGHDRYEKLQLLDEAIRRDLDLLARQPTTLFQCLWNSCWWHDCRDGAAHYELAPGEKWTEDTSTPSSYSGLSILLQGWREAKQRAQGDFPWLRSLRPPAVRLGEAQLAVFRAEIWGPFNQVAWSPDGRRVAANYQNSLYVWDVAGGGRVACLAAGRILAFSEDGRRVLTHNGRVQVWDLESGTCLESSPREVEAWGIAATRDFRRVAVGGLDGTLRVLAFPEMNELLSVRAHKWKIEYLALSADGRRVACASEDHAAKVWDVETGELVCAFTGHTGYIRSIEFAPDGNRIATCGDDTIRVWDALTGKEVASFAAATGISPRARFSPDGIRLAYPGPKGRLCVWEIGTGELTAEFAGHEDWIECLAWSPDGTRLATGSNDKTVRVWNALAKPSLVRVPRHDYPIDRVTASSDGRSFTSKSKDHTVKVWDAGDGAQLASLSGHPNIQCVACSPDGRFVAAGFTNSEARVWRRLSGQPVSDFLQHRDFVAALAFSPDSRWVASAGRGDRTVWVWEAETGRPRFVLRAPGAIVAVAFSPDGKRIVTGDWDGEARLWDAETGDGLGCLSGHTGGVAGVAFIQDGARIISHDGTLRIWDSPSGKCLEEFLLRDADGAAVAVSGYPDCYHAARGSLTTAVRALPDQVEVAWYPAPLVWMAASPAGRVWAGSLASHGHLHMFALEGDVRRERTIRPPVEKPAGPVPAPVPVVPTINAPASPAAPSPVALQSRAPTQAELDAAFDQRIRWPAVIIAHVVALALCWAISWIPWSTWAVVATIVLSFMLGGFATMFQILFERAEGTLPRGLSWANFLLMAAPGGWGWLFYAARQSGSALPITGTVVFAIAYGVTWLLKPDRR